MHPMFLAPLLAASLLLPACAPLGGGAGTDAPPRVTGVEVEPGPEPRVGAGRLRDQPASADGQGAVLGLELRQPPQWRSADGLVMPAPAQDLGDMDPIDQRTDGDSALPEGDPVLRAQVAERCASRPAGITEESLLQGIVADLDADGVEPVLAVDALIIGRCGDLADIVTEVVALAGEGAAMPVIERAVALTGSGTALIVERAATEGLLRASRERVAAQSASPLPLGGPSGNYAMLYFPVGAQADAGPDAAMPGAVSLQQLFGNAEPGYGMYTYILGGGADGTDERRIATYLELLRVIETYVLVGGDGAGRPAPSAHTFLVPVYADRRGVPLEERTGPELSAAMRRELAAYLRRGGQPELAARLATAPGPFLVSSLEPRLVPASLQSARMIVDLSGVGPEYMYSIVDAYDREIPRDHAGRLESLLEVRGRLIGSVPDRAIDGDGSSEAQGNWVYILGRPAATRVVADGGVRTAAADVRR